MHYYRAAIASAVVLQQTLFLCLFVSSIWIHKAIIPIVFVEGSSNISNNNYNNNKAKTGGGGGWFSKVIGSNFVAAGSGDDNDDHDDALGKGGKHTGILQQQQQQHQQQQQQPRDASFIGRQQPPFRPPPPPPPPVVGADADTDAASASIGIIPSKGDGNSSSSSSSSSRASTHVDATKRENVRNMDEAFGRSGQLPPPPPPPPPHITSQRQQMMQNPQSSASPTQPSQLQLQLDYNNPLHHNRRQQQEQQQEYQQQQQEYQQQEYQPQSTSMGMSMPYYDESNPPTTMGGGWMYDTSTSIKYEMDQLMFQQQQLYLQIQNLTTSLYETERSKEMQQSQIDLLLEQVADAEAYASAESNAALEYKANCTSLGNTVSELQLQIENWEQKCQQTEEDNRCKGEEIEKLKEKLKKKEKELESMACGIELARLEKQKQAYRAEYDKRKNARHRGLFHWLFGWMYGDDWSEDESDEELETLQEQARSMLLNALQAERNNVEELENALELEKQNNTAIAEMVASRDSLIDELNDRVAVFEEDKVVLKAALRQLQKEMKEEAPKTQKIVSELKSANAQIKILEADIDQLKKNHTGELALLETHLQEKQKEINETDSKMTMISVYVDQLEERLATFAVARRDIAVREKECDKLVNRSLALEEEVANLKAEEETRKTEQIEMKNLVDLLIQERTELQNEKMKLTDEKEKLVYEGKALREELDILNDNFLRIEKEAKDTLQKLEDSREIISSQERALDAMEKKMTSQQQEMTEKYGNDTAILQQEIQRLEEENQNAINMIRNLEDMLKDLEGDLEEAREQIKQLSIYDQSLNTIAAVQPPPPPPPPIDTSEEMDILTTEQKMDNVDQDIDEREEQKIMDHSSSSDSHDLMPFMELDKEHQIHSDNSTVVDQSNGTLNIEGLNEESFDDEELLLYDTHNYINSHDDDDDDLSEPELPNDSHDSGSSTVLASSPAQASSFTPQKRRVPLRAFRKKVSQLTGIHGFFTKPTSKIAKSRN